MKGSLFCAEHQDNESFDGFNLMMENHELLEAEAGWTLEICMQIAK